MRWLKAIISFLRAVINAPEMQHWISKYEAAKKDNMDLRKEIAMLRGEIKRGGRD